MGSHFQQVVNKLRREGRDYSDFKVLLNAITTSGYTISKDEILDFVTSDSRIQLFTTPNSIAKLICRISQGKKVRNALDLCCGTGNILYYLQNETDDLTGVEIVENIAELTKYFNPELKIITADSFKYPFTRKYDLVVGNIPFGMRIEMDDKRMPGEEAFLRKAFSLLTDEGRTIMLVPYSVLLSNQFKNFRKEFVSNVEEIVTLPGGILRNTSIKTAILVICKQESKEVKITQLNDAERLDYEYPEAPSINCSNEKLFERWDPEYQVAQSSSFYRELDSFQTSLLSEVAEIIKGKPIQTGNLKEEGDFLYLKPLHIQKDGLKTETALKYVSKGDLTEKDYRCILQSGDIVISTIFNDLKMYVYQSGDVPAIASTNLAIIRSSKQDYILSYLQTDEGKRIFKVQAGDLRKGVTIPHISIKDLANIKIPILPIADLNSLGDRSIEQATKIELQNQLELLRAYPITSKNEESPGNVVNEPLTLYAPAWSNELDQIKIFLTDRLKKIEEQLIIVNKKLDAIIDLIKDLRTDFIQIQKLPREEEEKLFKLYQKIDAKLDNVYRKEQQTIHEYIEEVKRWLDLWENLDSQSQKFLPIAELIFDELSKLHDADYAPFVVQYCRTLENEILKKLFEAYHTNGLTGIERDELVKVDLTNNKTGKFAQMVKRNKATYTLGDMNFIMALLKHGGNTLSESPLLQHFRFFTISYFDEKIVEADFLNDVNKLTNDFRNKAAHPYSISVELAKECQSLLRKSLNVFLESVKK